MVDSKRKNEEKEEKVAEEALHTGRDSLERREKELGERSRTLRRCET
jgi:hypothetical protein